MTPFIEGVFSHQLFDQHKDDNGIDREGNGPGFGSASPSTPIRS